MSALTQNERDGLEDVFLSIHSHNEKYQRIKELSTLLMLHKTTIDFHKLIKWAKIGLNETKISRFTLFYSKKKKNLSK